MAIAKKKKIKHHFFCFFYSEDKVPGQFQSASGVQKKWVKLKWIHYEMNHDALAIEPLCTFN